ncbi:MAG: sulfatase-like hydrolase/transferase, partial [Anaerolineae bacterium]|nr:sulfatase-like hydrolase/transferase [Anaerolineae bacterium]
MTDAYWREMIALTYGMITHVDTEIGRVLAVMDRLDLWDNTMVIFLGDHGDMMGDHGLLWKGPYTFRGCINIPTIVTVPGAVTGQINDTLVSQIDLLPSVLDFGDVPMPGSAWRSVRTPFERGSVLDLQPYPGCSWLALVEGAPYAARETVVIENDDPTLGFRARCLVTDRYRMTVYPGTGDGELFDLHEDPWELHNLWYRDGYKEIKSDLILALLDRYSQETPWYPIPPWNS